MEAKELSPSSEGQGPADRDSAGRRISRACEHCRTRKVRCSGHQPCTNCRQLNRTCIYRVEARQRRKRTGFFKINPDIRPNKPADDDAPPARSAGSLLSTTNNPTLHKKQLELRSGLCVSDHNTGAFQFYGPSSHFSFVQRTYQRLKRKEATPNGETSPVELGNWDLRQFIFSAGKTEALQDAGDVFLPRELGDEMIGAYFSLIHPQAPVLSYAHVMETWNNFWVTPSGNQDPTSKRLVQIVMAIGARVLSADPTQNAEYLDRWSSILAQRASKGLSAFEDPSVEGIQLIFLRAIYAEQIMKSNDVYMYLGHAARGALALGLNRAQMVRECGQRTHNLRLLFWTIYIHERQSALLAGRPSCLRDSQIDLGLPDSMEEHYAPAVLLPMMSCEWLRAAVELASVADQVLVFLGSPTTISLSSDLARVARAVNECEMRMEAMTSRLPPFLHFFDPGVPHGELWQEIQRSHLGFMYYLVRILLHRPALIFSTLFKSKTEAQETAQNFMDIQASIDTTTQSARDLIQHAHSVYFDRCPGIRNDCTIVTFIVYACVTLLYDVLDPGTDTDRARTAFSNVDTALHCFDQVVNVGTVTGKMISMDVMTVAKQAWASAGHTIGGDHNLLDDFPWLGETLGDDPQPCDPFIPPALFALQEPLLLSLFPPKSIHPVPHP